MVAGEHIGGRLVSGDRISLMRVVYHVGRTRAVRRADAQRDQDLGGAP